MNKYVNNFLVTDFETGGLDPIKNPATEVCMYSVCGVTLKVIEKFSSIIKPYDDSLIYNPVAVKISGITKEISEVKGSPLPEVVSGLIKVMESAKKVGGRGNKPIFTAHNAMFDYKFLQSIFKFCKKDLSKYIQGEKDLYGNFIPSLIDTIHESKKIEGGSVSETDRFNAAECCERAGIDHNDAHRAESDVVAELELLKQYINKGRNSSSKSTGVQVGSSKEEVLVNRMKFQL